MARRALLLCVLVTLPSTRTFAAEPSAGEPLHQRVDRLISAGLTEPLAPRSSDAEFFRRIHLDLAGCIPTAEQTRAFLQDTSPDKRQTVIDQLLASPGYADRMANLFHVMLMERRGDNEEWHAFLRDSFASNKPWDQMVREILHPDREQESLRGAAYFYTRRLEKVGQQTTDYPGLTRDVGRLFLGVDLQCAECHDHLFIDDYKQVEFQGLLSVYQNVSIRRESFPAINEKAMTGKHEFVSVFAEGKFRTGPRIPFGKEFEIPAPPQADPDEKPKQKKRPDPNDPPSFSALQLIAADLPAADNRMFRRNIANRLWFCMLGRGLVEPLDQFHSANQASHPELLQMLADELADHQFDMKWMIRELVLTETWQRSSQMPPGTPVPTDDSYRLTRQRRLTADQLLDSMLQATGNFERLKPSDGDEPNEEFKTLQAAVLAAFASEPKEPAHDYTPAVKQALFLLNDSQFLKLLEPQPSNLIDRLLKLPAEDVADELFLSVFSRRPDADEKASVEAFLEASPDERKVALAQAAWAMISSIEFCVNH